MISEKDKMIVDAVNFTEAYVRSDNVILETVRVSPQYPEFNVGSICVGYSGFNEKFYKEACTMKEYNQCIREMSEGAFVPDAKTEFVYGQEVYVEDPLFSNKELKFGCLTLKGDCAILLTGGGHMVYPLVGISSTPLKTKEEIELEEAKKKQVDLISNAYSHYFKSKSDAKDLFLFMQKRGDLSEIILPLESKQ